MGDTLEVRTTFGGRHDHAHLRAGGDGDLKPDAVKWESANTYLQTFKFDEIGKHELEAWVAGPSLKTYSVKHSFDVVDHLEWRGDIKGQIDNLFNSIQKLKAERIDEWKDNANIPESKIGLDVFMVVIAIVSEGIGGIAFGAIEGLLAKTTISSKALKEFAELAGLEAADLAAEKAFHEGIEFAKTDLEKGIASAADKEEIENTVKMKLATKSGAVDTFVAGMKLNTIKEEAELHKAFRESAAGRTDDDLINQKAVLNQFLHALGSHPEKFQQELTIGVIRLLDQAQFASAAKDKGRDPTKRADRDKTFKEDRELHENWWRAGNLMASPEESGRDGIGKWSDPDLSFAGFEVEGGGVNKETLHTLEGTTIEDLHDVTMAFGFSAHDPYDYAFGKGGMTFLDFVRSPDGDFYVPESSSDSPGEWLASYYTRQKENHTDSERELFAPKGAEKLYEAIKKKPVTDITWRKL